MSPSTLSPQTDQPISRTHELDIYIDEMAKIKITGALQQRVVMFIRGHGPSSAYEIKKGLGVTTMHFQQLREKKLINIFYQPKRSWPIYDIAESVKRAFNRAEQRCATLRAGDQPTKQP